MTPLAIDLIGAQVLDPDGLHHRSLSIADGRVSDAPTGRGVDLSGFLVLPGIVDLHGDGFERHIAPRRGVTNDMADGLRDAEAEIAANGITTAVMAQFWSWEGGLRGPEVAASMLATLPGLRGSVATDLQGQLRFEISLLEDYETLPGQIADWGVRYVVFNDHLPHDRLAAGKRPRSLTGQALKAGRNPERHLEFLQSLHARRPAVTPALDRLMPRLSAAGVRMGSHDDANAETRQIWAARGADIAEFPETVEAAEAARASGHSIVLGGPNAVRGGSHKGNANARDLIAAGLCDAIASDYHYPAPRRAALLLADLGVLPLEEAWALVSVRAAAVLGLSDRGWLLPGLRADLVVLDGATHRVAATISGGQISFLRGDLANRLLA